MRHYRGGGRGGYTTYDPNRPPPAPPSLLDSIKTFITGITTNDPDTLRDRKISYSSGGCQCSGSGRTGCGQREPPPEPPSNLEGSGFGKGDIKPDPFKDLRSWINPIESFMQKIYGTGTLGGEIIDKFAATPVEAVLKENEDNPEPKKKPLAWWGNYYSAIPTKSVHIPGAQIAAAAEYQPMTEEEFAQKQEMEKKKKEIDPLGYDRMIPFILDKGPMPNQRSVVHKPPPEIHDQPLPGDILPPILSNNPYIQALREMDRSSRPIGINEVRFNDLYSRPNPLKAFLSAFQSILSLFTPDAQGKPRTGPVQVDAISKILATVGKNFTNVTSLDSLLKDPKKLNDLVANCIKDLTDKKVIDPTTAQNIQATTSSSPLLGATLLTGVSGALNQENKQLSTVVSLVPEEKKKDPSFAEITKELQTAQQQVQQAQQSLFSASSQPSPTFTFSPALDTQQTLRDSLAKAGLSVILPSQPITLFGPPGSFPPPPPPAPTVAPIPPQTGLPALPPPYDPSSFLAQYPTDDDNDGDDGSSKSPPHSPPPPPSAPGSASSTSSTPPSVAALDLSLDTTPNEMQIPMDQRPFDVPDKPADAPDLPPDSNIVSVPVVRQLATPAETGITKNVQELIKRYNDLITLIQQSRMVDELDSDRDQHIKNQSEIDSLEVEIAKIERQIREDVKMAGFTIGLSIRGRFDQQFGENELTRRIEQPTPADPTNIDDFVDLADDDDGDKPHPTPLHARIRDLEAELKNREDVIQTLDERGKNLSLELRALGDRRKSDQQRIEALQKENEELVHKWLGVARELSAMFFTLYLHVVMFIQIVKQMQATRKDDPQAQQVLGSVAATLQNLCNNFSYATTHALCGQTEEITAIWQPMITYIQKMEYMNTPTFERACREVSDCVTAAIDQIKALQQNELGRQLSRRNQAILTEWTNVFTKIRSEIATANQTNASALSILNKHFPNRDFGTAGKALTDLIDEGLLLVHKVNEDNTGLTLAIQDKDSLINAKEDELATLRTEIEKLKLKLDSSTADANDIQTDLRKKINELEEREREVEARKSLLDNELSEQKRIVSSQQEELSSLRSGLANSQSENRALLSRIGEIETQLNRATVSANTTSTQLVVAQSQTRSSLANGQFLLSEMKTVLATAMPEEFRPLINQIVDYMTNNRTEGTWSMTTMMHFIKNQIEQAVSRPNRPITYEDRTRLGFYSAIAASAAAINLAEIRMVQLLNAEGLDTSATLIRASGGEMPQVFNVISSNLHETIEDLVYQTNVGIAQQAQATQQAIGEVNRLRGVLHTLEEQSRAQEIAQTRGLPAPNAPPPQPALPSPSSVPGTPMPNNMHVEIPPTPATEQKHPTANIPPSPLGTVIPNIQETPNPLVTPANQRIRHPAAHIPGSVPIPVQAWTGMPQTPEPGSSYVVNLNPAATPLHVSTPTGVRYQDRRAEAAVSTNPPSVTLPAPVVPESGPSGRPLGFYVQEPGSSNLHQAQSYTPARPGAQYVTVQEGSKKQREGKQGKGFIPGRKRPLEIYTGSGSFPILAAVPTKKERLFDYTGY